MKAAQNLIATLIGIFISFLLLEVLCQAYFIMVVAPDLEAQRNNPLHYYTASDDPALRYVLKPGSIEQDGKKIVINAFGLRDDSDSTAYPRAVALLGDSIVFGVKLSQEDTPPAVLQGLVGDSSKILNFGVPGYGLQEIQRFLEIRFPIYKPQQIFYVLNPNDFSRRDTIYEGADSGLYRMYWPPFFKLPFFVGKVIYLFMKGDAPTSVRWYRWLYDGGKKQGLEIIRKMAEYAKANGSEFIVVMFPPRVAYENGNFVLQDEFDAIHAYLKENGILAFDLIKDFGSNPARLQMPTDHPTAAGSKVMAAAIKKYIGSAIDRPALNGRGGM